MEPSTGTTTTIPLASTSTANNHNDIHSNNSNNNNNNDNDDPKISRPLRRGDLVRIADLYVCYTGICIFACLFLFHDYDIDDTETI